MNGSAHNLCAVPMTANVHVDCAYFSLYYCCDTWANLVYSVFIKTRVFILSKNIEYNRQFDSENIVVNFLFFLKSCAISSAIFSASGEFLLKN
jgi:hypothetical protein